MAYKLASIAFWNNVVKYLESFLEWNEIWDSFCENCILITDKELVNHYCLIECVIISHFIKVNWIWW